MGEQFCDGYNKTPLLETLKNMGLQMIPMYQTFADIWISDPLNDRAFLTGFINLDDWKKENLRLTTDAVSSGFYTAIDLQLAGGGGKAFSPLVKRVLKGVKWPVLSPALPPELEGLAH